MDISFITLTGLHQCMALGNHAVLCNLRTRYRNGLRRQKNGLQQAELADTLAGGQVWQTGGMGWHAAPLAAHAGQAIQWPACFFALDAFAVIGQVAFLKVMGGPLARVTQALGRVVRSFFYAIRNGKLLARVMNKVVTNCQLNIDGYERSSRMNESCIHSRKQQNFPGSFQIDFWLFKKVWEIELHQKFWVLGKCLLTFTAKTRHVFNFLSTYVAKLPFDNCPIRPCVSNGVLLIGNDKKSMRKDEKVTRN